MTLSTVLDNMIALVVIILVLSLMVQSVQQALKKLFKIKSRQIEESMLDLFENILGVGEAKTEAVAPMLKMGKNPASSSSTSVQSLYTAVTDEFKKMGRVAQSGKLMLDSISKEDLLRVLTRVAPGTLVEAAEFQKRFDEACKLVAEVEAAFNSIDATVLRGAAGAHYAAIQTQLTPLINDVKEITKTGTVNPKLVVQDILGLRNISAQDIFAALGQLQAAVETQLSTAQEPEHTALATASSALSKITGSLTALTQKFDAALAPLRTKLAQAEIWFDTVMQGFAERYTRGMKTWGLAISFVIVVLMNANLFDIYRKVTSSEAARDRIVQAADTVRQKAEALKTSGDSGDLKQSVQDLKDESAIYSSLQFKPLTWEDVTARMPLGDRIKILFGWILMTGLLSVGAPFWEDFLESLFGVKNLIRGKAELKNVEQASGAGNPKA